MKRLPVIAKVGEILIYETSEPGVREVSPSPRTRPRAYARGLNIVDELVA